jgi:hypothetical protein
MTDSPASRGHDVTRLNAAQRDWIRRQAQVARALEAAQHRAGRRFVGSADEVRRPEKRTPARAAP